MSDKTKLTNIDSLNYSTKNKVVLNNVEYSLLPEHFSHSDDGYEYLAPGQLVIRDFTIPEKPKFLHSFELPYMGFTHVLTILKDTLYIAGSGIAVFDVTNSKSPKLLNIYETNDLVKSIAVIDNAVYINQGSEIIDLSTNHKPTGNVTITGKFKQGENLTANNTLSDGDGIKNVNYYWFREDHINNIVGYGNQYSLTQKDVGKKIQTQASYTDDKGTTEFVDSLFTTKITNVNDKPLGLLWITKNDSNHLIANNSLVDSDGIGSISYKWYRDGILIPHENAVEYIEKPSDVKHLITVKAKYIDGFKTTETIESTPAPMESIIGANITSEYGEVIDVKFVGNFAYVLNSQLVNNGSDKKQVMLNVLDISNPSQPKKMGNFLADNNTTIISIVGNVACLYENNHSDWNNPVKFNFVDIRNPLEIQLLGDYTYSTDEAVINVNNNIACIIDIMYPEIDFSNGGMTLQFIDFNQPSNLQIGSYSVKGVVQNIKISNNIAYIFTSYMEQIYDASGEKGRLDVVDLSNIKNPKLLYQYDTFGWVDEVVIQHDKLYVISDIAFAGEDGVPREYGNLEVFDFSDLYSPKLGSYDIGGTGYSLTVINDSVYVYVNPFSREISESGGIKKIDVNDLKQIKLLDFYNHNEPAWNGNKSYQIVDGNLNLATVNPTLSHDDLLGTKADDKLFGLQGNDTLNGLLGADTLIGGLGDDIYFIDNKSDSVIEKSNEGIDLVASTVTYILRSNVENLTLLGNDVINGTGNKLDNIINGNDVKNTIKGLDGNDILNGFAGDDVLVGGKGIDTLTGGLGSDKFVFQNLDDLSIPQDNYETITDFNHTEKDKIDLSTIDADTTKSGNQAFSNIVDGTFTKAGQLFFDTSSHILYGNVNSDSSADFAINVIGIDTLDMTDIIG